MSAATKELKKCEARIDRALDEIFLSVQIDDEFRALIPRPSNEELQQLEENLKREGCRDPLVVWRGLLIDGHNRYDICNRNRIPFKLLEHKDSCDRDDVKTWIITNQLGRRNLSPFVRAELALKLEPLIATKAKTNQAERKGSQAGASSQNSVKLKPVDTQKQVAKAAGVSHDTIHKAKQIKSEGASELIAAVRSEQISIDAAAKVATLPKAKQIEVVNKGPSAVKKVVAEVKKVQEKERLKKRIEKDPEEVAIDFWIDTIHDALVPTNSLITEFGSPTEWAKQCSIENLKKMKWELGLVIEAYQGWMNAIDGVINENT